MHLLRQRRITGFVLITAEPLTPSMGQAIIIGGGGFNLSHGMKLMDLIKIDDISSSHSFPLLLGWGALLVAWFQASFGFS